MTQNDHTSESDDLENGGALEMPTDLDSGSTRLSWMKSRKIRCLAGCGLLLAMTFAVSPVQRTFMQYQVDSWRTQCQTAKAAGDWATLASASDEWLQRHPESGEAITLRALAFEQTGDIQDACDVLDTISDDADLAIPALAARVTLQLERLNCMSDAILTCARMLRIDPADSFAHEALIHVYATTLQFQNLNAQIRTAIRSGCESPAACWFLFMPESRGQVGSNMECLRWKRVEPANEHLLVAWAIYVARQRENDAPLRDAIERFSDNPDLTDFRIHLAIDAGDWEAVSELLASVSPPSLKTPGMLGHQARLHEQLGNDDEALVFAREALKKNPFGWKTRLVLSRVLRKMNLHDQAEREQRIANQGRTLEEALQDRTRWPNVVLMENLEDLTHYAKNCGDSEVHSALVGIRKFDH